MKNTAAPWSIDGHFDADTAVGIISGDPNGEYTTICELEPLTGEWSDEEIDNARLMAAAPELMEVARNAMRLLRDLGFRRDNPNHPVWANSEAVFAKAKGR